MSVNAGLHLCVCDTSVHMTHSWREWLTSQLTSCGHASFVCLMASPPNPLSLSWTVSLWAPCLLLTDLILESLKLPGEMTEWQVQVRKLRLKEN